MKTIKTIMLSIMLLLAPAYAFSSGPGYMRISYMEGDVQVRTPDSGDWGPASINTPLAEGDQVWAPQGSRVELQLNYGTYMRLDQDSALQVLSEDSDSSQLYLSQGRAYVNFKAPGGSVIQFDTPDASTRAFNRAIFSVDIPGQYTNVTVYKGYAESENSVGMTRVNAGEMLALGRDTNGEIAPAGPADEWQSWNREQDSRIYARKRPGYRYLPPELSSYAPEFDDYGRWVDVPDYGYCWTPIVPVGANWAPYRTGRWIWWHGDYVWVPFESWGWVPCHYGRWSFVPRVGWCWIPPPRGAVYWGPGYVGWVRTPDYVAWVPLAPGETYYGRGYYGPHSVNITKVNINQVNITNVYKNVYINNAVTVVKRNTFSTGSPAVVNVNRNIIQRQIFTRGNISPGAPAIRPARAAFFASAKPVPPSKLPPPSVRNVKVRALKQSHPFVRAPGRSAVNPAAAPAKLPVTMVARPEKPGRQPPALKKIQPPGKGKPAMPGMPGPKGQRPNVKPIERAKPAQPLPGGAKPALRPETRKKPALPTTPQPRVEIPKAPTMERIRPLPPTRQAPAAEFPRSRPTRPERPMTPAVPQPQIERPKPQPVERPRPVAPMPTFERPRIQPEKHERPAMPTPPQPRVEKPQVRPVARPRPAPPPAPAPPVVRPQPRPERTAPPEKPAPPEHGGRQLPGEPGQAR